MGWWSVLGRWFRTARRRRAFKPVVRLDVRSFHLSEKLLAKGAPVLEMKGEHAVWLHLPCPCRCRVVLRVNLMRSQSPFWHVVVDAGGRITVDPSLDVIGCGSHFWIRESRIHWV